MKSAHRNTRPNGSSAETRRSPAHFVCVRNKYYAASLEVRKIYQTLADDQAQKHGHLRVIDESGEDYLYPADYFVPIKLPQSAEKAVLQAGA